MPGCAVWADGTAADNQTRARYRTVELLCHDHDQEAFGTVPVWQLIQAPGDVRCLHHLISSC